MAFGCQGPFVNGTGGWCGCDCKCCPPDDMVQSILLTFGPPAPAPMAAGEYTANHHLNLPGPPQEMPEFDTSPIVSENMRFVFGAPGPLCSVPCEAFNVIIKPGPVNPLCGFQVINGNIIAVGNGFVTADPLTHTIPDCGTIQILINGQVPPVLVADGQLITVTLMYLDPWNEFCCACVELVQVPGMYLRAIEKGKLFKYAMVGKKPKINPLTGLKMVVIDKAEVRRRIEARMKQLRRKK